MNREEMQGKGMFPTIGAGRARPYRRGAGRARPYRRNTGWRSRCTVAAACLFVAVTSCDDRPAPEGAPPPTPASTEPAIKQARWQIKAYPSATVRPLKNKDKRRIRAAKPEVKKLVRDVYDVLFLSEGDGQSVIRTSFTARAADALVRSGAGIPHRLTEVKTTVRRAHIGIGAASARQAAARVWLQARAYLGADKVRISHRSTLWLEKRAGTWRAIAFDVKQRPAA